MQFHSNSDIETEAIAAKLSALIEKGCVIHLQGDLGAGKTTFSRGFINALGFEGAVKSPTYNIVQSYELPEVTIYHFDLYRLAEPDELEALGFRDYFDGQSVCLLEWPEKGEGCLPAPDLNIFLEYLDESRSIEIKASSELGHTILNKLKNKT